MRIARRRPGANETFRERIRLPIWAIGLLVAGIFVALAALIWLEEGVSFPPKTTVGWMLLVPLVGLLYFVLTIIAEAGAELLQSDNRVIVRAVPIAVIVVLYVVWYAMR